VKRNHKKGRYQRKYVSHITLFYYICKVKVTTFFVFMAEKLRELNFPPIKLAATERDGKPMVFDTIRRSYVVLTPEEWVRRHVVEFLISHCNVPRLSITQEYPVNINSTAQRADIVVFDSQARPLMLVECKAPDVDIDNEVAMQAWRYNSVLRARYVLLTNGRSLWCYEYHNGQYRAIRF
jgi:hypothetical protein